MPNYNILFGTQPTDILSLNAKQQEVQGQRNQNALLMGQIGGTLLDNAGRQIQNDASQQEAQRKDAQFQLGDMAQDAIRLKPLLAAGDGSRANVMLAERIQKIQARGGDASDTMAFRDALNSGQMTVEQAIGELDGVVDAATRAGALELNGGITEYQRQNLELQRQRLAAAQNMTPAQQAYYELGNRRLDEQNDPTLQADISGSKRRAELLVDTEIRPSLEASIEESKTTAKIDAERKGGVFKAISDEKEVGRILDLAEPLLSKATESLAGVALDKTGKLVGLSSEGSRAAAKLKTLEGALIMKMPRMEGPQSNLDQQLYRQMAAQIGDAATPSEERQAAVDILRDLNARYTGQQAPDGVVPQAPGSAIPDGATATNPQTGQKIIFRGGQWQTM